MTSAIPLFALDAAGLPHGGSGFLLRRAGVLSLITAAHLPIKAQPYVTDGWDGWPATISALMMPERAAMEIPLVSGGQALFRYLATDTGKMADMLALTGPAVQANLDYLANRFDVIDLEHGVPVVEAGAPVYALGYPVAAPLWPVHSICHGSMIELVDLGMIEADMPVEDGYSGGPCFSGKGAFLGMSIGLKTHEVGAAARVVSPMALAEVAG